jgi:hypothetical protein
MQLQATQANALVGGKLQRGSHEAFGSRQRIGCKGLRSASAEDFSC